MASAPVTPSGSSLDHLSARRRKLEQLHRKTLSFSGTTPPSNLTAVNGSSSSSSSSNRTQVLKSSSSPRPSSPLLESIQSKRSAHSKFSNTLLSPPPSSTSSSSSSSSADSQKKVHHRSRLPKDFDKSHVRKSCTALLKHAHPIYIQQGRHRHQQPKSLEADLNRPNDSNFTDGEPIYINIQTYDDITPLRSIVPYLIPLPNRIRPKLSELSICLITRDPRAPVVAVLDTDKSSPTHGVFTEIVSTGKLRSRLISFAEIIAKKNRRRHLDSNEPPTKKTKHTHENPHKVAPAYVKSFDIIVNDAEITAESLTHIFGPGVYLKPPGIKHTVPVPISLQPPIPEDATPVQIQKIRDTIADPLVIKNQLKYIARSSAVIKAPGKNLSILVGLSSFTPEQLMENVAAAISNVLSKQSTLIPGSWDNVKAITVKTAKSASMPIYKNTKQVEPTLNGKNGSSKDADEDDNSDS